MKESSSFFVWVAGASIAMHVALVVVLPNVTPKVSFASSMIEVTDLPPPPLPPPTVDPPRPEAAPAKSAAPRATAAAPKDAPSPAAVAPSTETPLDFTGTIFSGEGPGVAVTTAGDAPRGPAGPSTPPPAAREPFAGPRFLPVSDLARAPRAPALDAALERNYPIDARRAGVSGNAVLRVQILADGRIGTVERLSETFHGFGESCERTVRSARWEAPTDREGVPVITRITYTCRFEVRS
jgi:protein TonB